MKNFKFISAIIGLGILFSACTKEPPLPTYFSGRAPNISTRDTVLGPSASDSNKYIFRLRWDYPFMATDFKNVKFVSQLDLATGDFSNPLISTVLGSFSDSIQAKTINDFLLQKGIAFNTFVPMKVRVLASYSNNNDLHVSNEVALRFRTYKVPPKVTLPVAGDLFIVGDATNGGWNLPLPAQYTASQKFIRVDETTWAAKMFLFGSKSYLMVPKNDGTGWDLKYASPNSGAANASTSGPFGYRPSSASFNDNFPSPTEDGWYKITFDFQNGFYTLTDSKDTPVPDSLYAIGDGTAGGWDNSNENAALKGQYFTKLNSGVFERNLNLTAGLSLKFITKITQWQPQFGKSDVPGQLGYNYGGGSDPGTITIPPASGTYKVRVDFLNMTYTLTKL